MNFALGWLFIVAMVHVCQCRPYTLEILTDPATGILNANGSTPGPTIFAYPEELLDLTISNLSNDSITIHLHGIVQSRTTFYDGTAGISQIPIPPGGTFKILAEMPSEPGTYYYHAHHSFFDRSVFGPLLIQSDTISINRKNPFRVGDRERVLVLSDFWFKDARIQLEELLAPNKFKWIGMPDMLLINGKPDLVVTVRAGDRYKFRVIGATSLVYLSLAFENHDFEIVECDGITTIPVKSNILDVNAGQRYSIVMRISDVPGDYRIIGKVRWRKSDLVYRGTLRVVGKKRADDGGATFRSSNDSETLMMASMAETPDGQERRLIPSTKQFDLSGSPDLSITLFSAQVNNSNSIRWVMNNVSFEMLPESDSLLDRVYGNTDDKLPRESQMISLENGQIVQVVLQALGSPSGTCEGHLHGHSFWIIGSGPGQYEKEKENDLLTRYPKIMRDTTTLYPYSGAYFQDKISPGEPCGWKVIRFRADNPGVWPLHCHITAHMVMGMMVVFKESPGLIISPK